MEDSAQFRVRLLLSVQGALLGAVPAALREVTCGWEGTEIRLRFVFDGEIDPDDYESAQIAGSEVIADFPRSWTIAEEIIRIDYPADLREIRPVGNTVLAYERKERSTSGQALQAPISVTRSSLLARNE
jgi:hypothetical protein